MPQAHYSLLGWTIKNAGGVLRVHQPPIRPTKVVGQQWRDQGQAPSNDPIKGNQPTYTPNSNQNHAQHSVPQNRNGSCRRLNMRIETVL